MALLQRLIGYSPGLCCYRWLREITIDAIDWLATQGVPLIRLRWDGQFASIITTGGQAASGSKVYWQEKTRDDPTARLEFAVGLILEKTRATLFTMEEDLPRSTVWERARRDIAIRAKWLEQKPPRSIEDLLGIEGAIAADYFRIWSGISLKWKALKQHPIPANWTTYISRGSRSQGSRNRGSTHPVNAMLNYAYGVLIAQTRRFG